MELSIICPYPKLKNLNISQEAKKHKNKTSRIEPTEIALRAGDVFANLKHNSKIILFRCFNFGFIVIDFAYFDFSFCNRTICLKKALLLSSFYYF